MLSRGNAWAKNAPLIIAAVTETELGCRRTGRDYHSLDIGLSMENMLLQGIHLGLVMHPIAGFDEAGMKELLGVPDPFRIFALIIVGHPGVPEHVDAITLQKEAEKPERLPLDQIAFFETWD